jgi:DnaJ family protein A protein 2
MHMHLWPLMISRCKKCKGEKTVEEKTRQEIFIEKGMPDGHRIVLAGAGDQQVGNVDS